MSIWLLIVGALLIFNTVYWVWMMHSIGEVPASSSDLHNASSVSLIVVFRLSHTLPRRQIERWMLQRGVSLRLCLFHDGESNQAELDELRKFIARWPQITLQVLPKKGSGKKHALADALADVESEWVILTDDDGIPQSHQWITKAVSHAQRSGAQIVILYGPYLRRSGWLQRSIRFENVVTAWQYFSWWRAGRPYMGVGRNLLYSREVCDAYRIIQPEIASGDDDLFFQDVAGRYPVSALIDPDTFVYSEPPDSLTKWLIQKTRHLTTAPHYPWRIKFLLGSFSISQISIPIAFGYLLLKFSYLLGILLGVRWILFYILGRRSLKILQEEALYPYLPILDVLHGLYLGVVAVVWPFRSTKKW